MSEQAYRWTSSVRDYELDAQGIVNHATYINYLEQCRNDYGRSLGLDYLEYYKAGYAFVVAGIEIQYRAPLKPQDVFYVTALLTGYDEKRLHFDQEIRHVQGDTLAAKATVHIACVDLHTGKSAMPDNLKTLLAAFPSSV